MAGDARDPSDDDGPLEGITVLDASRVLVGAFCGMQLGNLGADVIKIERPDGGDQSRGWTPPTYGDSEEAAYYLSINRNKRSVTLNLATETGRDVFRTLAANADVLLHNYRVGKMAEWGLTMRSCVSATHALFTVTLVATVNGAPTDTGQRTTLSSKGRVGLSDVLHFSSGNRPIGENLSAWERLTRYTISHSYDP